MSLVKLLKRLHALAGKDAGCDCTIFMASIKLHRGALHEALQQNCSAVPSALKAGPTHAAEYIPQKRLWSGRSGS